MRRAFYRPLKQPQIRHLSWSPPPVFPESATSGRVRSQPPVRIGVVGLGLAGTLMAAALAEHPRMQIAAAADVSDELRERFEQKTGLPAYSSIEAMLLKAP